MSIVTPAYNREKYLKKCWESLQHQTDQSFEWIVVDDGSMDHTGEAVEVFIKNSTFKISYLYKENGGKHTALNAAHPFINGQYVLLLDSDDRLTDDAVETIRSGWERFDTPDIGMIIWMKGRSETDPNCVVKKDSIPVDYRMYDREIIHSRDCCEVIRTELFLKYPFPEFENERFISEGALWNRAANDALCIYQNKVIYLCEYLEGGLTRSGKKMRIKNPQGGMYTSYLRMDRHQKKKERIKGAILYDCYGFFAGMNVKTILLKEKGHAVLKTAGLFPGYLLYRKWKAEYSG